MGRPNPASVKSGDEYDYRRDDAVAVDNGPEHPVDHALQRLAGRSGSGRPAARPCRACSQGRTAHVGCALPPRAAACRSTLGRHRRISFSRATFLANDDDGAVVVVRAARVDVAARQHTGGRRDESQRREPLNEFVGLHDSWIEQPPRQLAGDAIPSACECRSAEAANGHADRAVASVQHTANRADFDGVE
jgi:hypothetical protein